MWTTLQIYWLLLAKYLRKQISFVILLTILLILNVGLAVTAPQIVRAFIDTAIERGPRSELIYLAIGFLIVVTINQIVAIGATYYSEKISWAATNLLRRDLLAHCFTLDQKFHKRTTAGELIERIDGDVTTLSKFFSNFTMYIFSNVLLLISILLLLFREDWRIGASMTLLSVLAIGIMVRIKRYATPFWVDFRQIVAAFSGFIDEVLTTREDLIPNGGHSYIQLLFTKIIRKWYPIRLKTKLVVGTLHITALLIFALNIAFAFGISAYLWGRGMVTIGTIYLIFYYTELLRMPVAQIRDQLANLQQADASIERVQALLAFTSHIQDIGDQTLPDTTASIQYQNVSFAYDQQRVLNNVTFSLPAGEVLGVLGATGSGKTTLVNLLPRQYDPQNGQILFAGIPLQALKLTELRQHIVMVTQNIELFKASVRHNLTFFRPDIPDEKLHRALTEIGLSDWVNSLPQGLDTVIKSDEFGLSTGQAQLLALSRAFLSDPKLIILDEVSSHIDPLTESYLDLVLDKLIYKRTCIMIAHRLKTIERADKILILDQGQVVEFGNRIALQQDPNSHLSKLLQHHYKR